MSMRKTIISLWLVWVFLTWGLLAFWATQINSSGLGNEDSWEVMDTEWKLAPEMIVDDSIFDQMPTVEEELSSNEFSSVEEIQELPKEINLDMPFFAQAPDADWRLPWKEACEESSIILAHHFLEDKELSKQEFKRQVLELVDLQEEMFWDYIDTSIAQTAEMLEEYYGYTNYEIIDNPSIEDLKKELAQWHPIIAPFAGKELWNGFFTNGWPRYHMLVVVWYNDEFFLTNDVGTSRGENFAYSYETLMDAMHDLVREGDITSWEKRVLVMR